MSCSDKPGRTPFCTWAAMLRSRHAGMCCVILFSAGAVGCVASPTEQTSLKLELAGTSMEPVSLDDQSELIVRQAEVAFGPLYLCSGRQAGQLCDSALLEWRSSAVIDALDPNPKQTGTISGLTGTVRSYMFDFGFASTLARSEPVALNAVDDLGGYSARFSGEVEQGGVTIPFSLSVLIVQSQATEPGTTVVSRSSTSELTIFPQSRKLSMRFDALPWMQSLRAADFFQNSSCDAKNQITCDGQVEQRCDSSGTLVEASDCSAKGLVCVPDQGCQTEVTFSANSRAYRAVVQSMVGDTLVELSVD